MFIPFVEERGDFVRADGPKRKFRPGGLAPITGVYAVNHGIRHRDRHEVVIIRGEELPSCRTCKLNVWFEMVRPISHITHDWDFSGPANLVVKLRGDDFKDFRIFHRGHVELPIRMHLSTAPKSEIVRGCTNDLGAGGLGAVIRGSLPAQFRTETVKIAIEQQRESLTIPARLRYQCGVRYGFEFVNVNAAEREALRRIITRCKIHVAAVPSGSAPPLASPD